MDGLGQAYLKDDGKPASATKWCWPGGLGHGKPGVILLFHEPLAPCPHLGGAYLIHYLFPLSHLGFVYLEHLGSVTGCFLPIVEPGNGRREGVALRDVPGPLFLPPEDFLPSINLPNSVHCLLIAGREQSKGVHTPQVESSHVIGRGRRISDNVSSP